MANVRLISQAEIQDLRLDAQSLIAALGDAFKAFGDGRLIGRPKSSILPPDGSFYMTAVACWPEIGLGLFHNILGTAAANVPKGAPHYTTHQLVGDYKTAQPIALVDGSFTSTMLPAGVTALSARYLARKDSRIATFVGAGLQARVNLEGLRYGFPLEEVRILSRTPQSAAEFASFVLGLGLKPIICPSPRDAVAGADIIVTSVPSGPGLRPFLEPGWVSPGAFVSAVDVGRSWLPGFEAYDRTVTDDREQALSQHREGRMAFAGIFDTEISELLASTRPGREKSDDRVVVIHPGNIAGVFGITTAILRKLGIVS